MKIDSNLLNEFAKITNDKDNKETPKNVYGTIVKNGDETYVRLDGSEDGCLTPVTMTMDADNGDAVLCKIENHTVTVVGNVEHPAQSLKSSSAYNTIEEIVGGMAITSKGVKVFYQENEPEGTAEYPLNPGDTWYKLDPDTGLAITIFVYTKDLMWKETALTINAANVTGKLTANQIDASELEVNAANVTGKLTANQIDASELVVEDANIKSINGNKIKDGTIIAAALSHEAILTASGVKVYYQPVEPQRTLISSVVNGATTSWYEDNEGHIMRDGDTWYKTVKMANDPKDYCQIVYVYNSSTNQFKETPLDAAVLRENSITAREIDVNELAANEAFINRLKVNAANVTGKLTANQIDATGLKVNAANVTGKLTANQIDATGLKVNAANVTGKLTANQIDVNSLVVGINVGSTQLLRGTNSSKAIAKSGTWDNGGWRYATLNSSSSGRNRVFLSNPPNPLCRYGFRIVYNSTYTQHLDVAQDNVPVCVGETYTLSTYVKGSGIVRLQYGGGYAGCASKSYNVDTETWQKIYYTFTVDSAMVKDNRLTNIYIGIRSGDVYFACIKLEKGNVATEWSEYEGDTSVENIYKAGTTKIDGGKIDTGSLTAENVLVKDSSGNVIFDANSSNNTVKIGDIVVTTDLLNRLTNAVRLATGKALVVSAPNLSISEDGTITAKNGNFTGAINATSGSFKGTVTSGSTISGSKIVTNGRTAINNNITGLYANTDGFDYCFSTTDPHSDDITYHHVRFDSSGLSIDGVLTYDGDTRLGGMNVGKMLNLSASLVCDKGLKQFMDADGNNLLTKAVSRKSVTADNISISANSYKTGTVTIKPSSGYEVCAVAGFTLGNASSSGTGSSNCAVSACNVTSINASSSTISYQINTWSSSAVKVKLVIMCLQRPIN